MKKTLKILAVVAVVVIAGIVGLVALLVSNVDKIVKVAVEQGGTYAMGVSTTLDGASVKLSKGEAALTGLNIANPPGFKSAKFMSIGKTDAALNIRSTQTQTVELSRLGVADLTINIEGELGKMNYKPILDNLSKLSSGQAKGPPSSSDKKFMIQKIELTNLEANVSVGGLGAVKVPIKRVELSNVGTGGKAVSGAQITQVILQAVLQAVATHGQGVLPADLLGDLTGELSKLEDLGVEELNKAQKQLEGEINKRVQEAGKQMDKALEDAVKKASDAVGGGLDKLIPKRKEDEKKPPPK